jgi:hypothetical protein
MKYRKLRISWSVACGILCLLLIALWVRSYSQSDVVAYTTQKKREVFVGSSLGQFSIGTSDQGYSQMPLGYHFRFSREIYGSGPFRTIRSQSNRMGFGVFSRWGFNIIAVPQWCPLFVTAIIAAIAWPKWAKRFSLRTLLIGITVVAALLGLLVWAMNRPGHI